MLRAAPIASAPPAVGDLVVVRLPLQREISTGVLESSGRRVLLDLPPVVHTGARLDLLWGCDGAARAAVATVIPTSRRSRSGLALSLGDVYAVERRVLDRWKPRQPLRAHVALLTGESLTGPVLNLSLGGFAARLEHPMHARTAVEATLVDHHGAPIVLAVESEVRRCVGHGPSDHVVSVAFRARGVVAMALARLR